MLIRYKILVMAAVSLLTSMPCRSDGPKERAAIEDELKAIEGIWQTAKWRQEDAEGYQVQVGVGERNEKMKDGVYCSLTFHVVKDKGPNAEVGFGMPVQVRAGGDKAKRWFEISEASAKTHKLPAKLYFRPDGENLILTLDEGPYKGEYKLRKLKAAKPAKLTVTQVAREWTYLGTDKDFAKTVKEVGHVIHDVESFPSGTENHGAFVVRVNQKGRGKEHFAAAAKFYASKCGSDRDPAKKRVIGDHGEGKLKGQYLITELALTDDLRELLFSYVADGQSVTALLQRQDDDVIRIVLTVVIR